MSQNNTGVIHTEPTPLQRFDALKAAREVLLVKAGKYAERDLYTADLLMVADWILTGTVAPDASSAEVHNLLHIVKGEN